MAVKIMSHIPILSFSLNSLFILFRFSSILDHSLSFSLGSFSFSPRLFQCSVNFSLDSLSVLFQFSLNSLSILSQFCSILSRSLSIPAHVSVILFQFSFDSLAIHSQFSFIIFPFSPSSCSFSLILPQFFLILSPCSFSSLLFSRIPLSFSLSSLYSDQFSLTYL